MAYYSESGYCAEEARRPYAEPGFCHGEGGGERYAVVRKEYEEVDELARAGRGHHYGHGHSGSGHQHRHVVHAEHEGSCHGGYLGLGEEHREQHQVHGHGHGGRRLYDACESKRYDSCTGQYYA
ncbi:hypothetical protein BDA96_03G428600 [Sorghum bicolor]|uniref:Uncharacterized protein n=2 Tax=Sorghum bicolor TaxID=4558 RepID=C5XFK9_SORBI|nr:hypothetical protein SORBI_3003G397400 [Sorghum bicolor]KAG0540666.1 hypothetical protein BDA96_03G428600 [Sorghum bicolor]